MNWQRDKVLIIISTLCLILSGVAGFFIFKFGGQFSEARDEYDSAMSSIRRMAGDGIEPTRQNFEVLEKNLEGVTRFKEEKIAWLRERQFEPIDLPPIDFTSEVGKRVDGWEALTKEMSGENESSVVTNAPTANEPAQARPQDTWGGFENYGRDGRPPAASHVSRLTIQLQSVDMLVQLLLRANVEEVVSITRDTDFEKEDVVVAQPSSTERDADGEEAVEPELPLYESEKYTIVFRSDEATVWDVVQQLNESEHHVTVTKVLFRNENAELQPMFADKRTSGSSARPSARRVPRGRTSRAPGGADPQAQRDIYTPKPVSAGLEMVFATVDLRIFRFPAPSKDEAEEDGEAAEGGDESATPAQES